MRQFFLTSILISTAAVFVVRRHCGVVVAGDAGDAAFAEARDDLVRPGRVADRVAQVVDGVGVVALGDVGEHGVERGEVGVDVGMSA